ncbi:MAG TPA: pectinesterase family protein [Kineosporiaceae bacterium]|nr:pectinesterase family protein [Kineosporiaceae bacterium]
MVVPVVAGAAVLVSALPAQAASAPVAGSTYQLAVAKSGQCLDVAGGSTGNGGLLQQWGCSGGAAWQQFKVVSAGSGQFTLVNVKSAKCVDVPAASAASGVQINQWTCSGNANQRWTFTASGSGTYQVKSVSSGLCLSDKGASTASGSAIIQESCTANSNKQWAFTLVGGGSTSPTGPTTVAADGSGTYRTVQAAVDAVPANNTSRVTITIKPGTYREVVTVPATKPFITLQGTGSSASNVVIVYNHSANSSGTSGSATAFLNGHDFTATNLTIANDFDESSVTSGGQAVAVSVGADRATFTNVRFLGDQDTLLVNDSARMYMTQSYVEGTVDFIFGGGIAVFNATEVHEKRTSGGPITAASTAATKTYGFLFYKCTITGTANGVTGLGRPWRANAQVLYRESSLSATMKTSQPWTDMSDNSWKNARFKEYLNTGSGATTNSNRPQLAASEAANYTPQKYLAGADGWNPL